MVLTSPVSLIAQRSEIIQAEPWSMCPPGVRCGTLAVSVIFGSAVCCTIKAGLAAVRDRINCVDERRKNGPFDGK